MTETGKKIERKTNALNLDSSNDMKKKNAPKFSEVNRFIWLSFCMVLIKGMPMNLIVIYFSFGD